VAEDGSAIPAVDGLRLALAEADFALTAASTAEEERIAALLALKAIYDFSKSVGLRSRALNNLSMALQDIDRGNFPALFSPSRKSPEGPGEAVYFEGCGSRSDAAAYGLRKDESRRGGYSGNEA
jgi:hypothetical protein